MINLTTLLAKGRNRRNASGAFGIGATTPAWAWDFVNNKARAKDVNVGALANTPNWTSTPATHSGGLSTYAESTTGLQAFASGELRRTDKGVLIEGARTNLCLQSQTLDNASWAKGNGGVGSVAVVSADYAVAPDGTTTADRIQFSLGGGTTTSDISSLQQNFTVSSATAYTVSVWLKSNTGSSYSMSLHDPAAARQNITVTPDWQRFTYTATTGSTSYALLLRLRGGLAPADSATADVSAWGFQLEQASFVSSYIPTTTASATRAADSLSITGVTGLDYPLSLFCKFSRSVDTGGNEVLFGVDTGSSNDSSIIRVNSSDVAQLSVTDGGASQGTPSAGSAISVGTSVRVAARISANSLQIARSGTLGTEDTSATMPDAPTSITFGCLVGGSAFSYAYIEQASIWTRALTDAELQALAP